MARPSLLRNTLKLAAAGVVLASAASPAAASTYKFLIKGPVCATAPYCFVEFNYTSHTTPPAVPLTVPVTINLPAYNPPTGVGMPALTFSGNVSVRELLSKICKPGTNGKLEWLAAGSNVEGISGNLTATDPGNGQTYTLSLTFATQHQLDDSKPATCTTYGQETYQYVRGYGITRLPRTTILTGGTYHVYDTASIPEPETLALLAIGLGALGFSVRRRRH